LWTSRTERPEAFGCGLCVRSDGLSLGADLWVTHRRYNLRMGRECRKCGREMFVVPLQERNVWHCEECGEVIQSAADTSIESRLDAELERLRLLPAPARHEAAKSMTLHADASLWSAIAASIRATTKEVEASGIDSANPDGNLASAVVASVALAFIVFVVLVVLDLAAAAFLVAPGMGLLVLMAWRANTRTVLAGLSPTRARAKRVALIDVVLAAQDPMAVVALAEAVHSGGPSIDVIAILKARLTMMLPRLTHDQIVRISPADQEMIASLLPEYFGVTQGYEWDLVVAICDLIAETDLESALVRLDGIASGVAGCPDSARAAARNAAEKIRHRLEERRQNQQLLRAASDTDTDSDTLLRPATAGAEPTEQLLRPFDRGGDQQP
jgi:hypothetical protein